MDYLQKHSTHIPGVFKNEQDMVWWALIVSNIASGFLLAYILLKGRVNSMTGGIVTGAIVGVLMSVAYDCMMFAQMNVIGRAVMAVDVAASAVVTGIIGGMIGWYYSRGENGS